jgi:C-terminal processing protease CtpA/Prc
MVKQIFLVLISLFFLRCENVPQYPSEQDDLIEMESVWQYLKAYSIYQDECVTGSGTSCQKRLRDNPYVYNSPQEMMDLLHDTLKGASYTKYDLTMESGKDATIGVKTSETRLVEYYPVTVSTVLLRIRRFDTDITYHQFCEVMRSCSSFTNCIVDVCQNPGGDLDELDSILEQFLPENTPYILARERAYDSTTHQYHTVDFRPLKTKRPASPYLAGKKVVVLMDGGSASAAEILALGLKDGYGAILAGNTSYGKAIGQIKLPRRGRKWLQITFLQLKGISAGEYQNKGLKPDIVISNIDMYNQGTSLLSVVRLVEPGVKAADIRKPSSSLKKVASAIPEGYVIRDVELGP